MREKSRQDSVCPPSTLERTRKPFTRILRGVSVLLALLVLSACGGGGGTGATGNTAAGPRQMGGAIQGGPMALEGTTMPVAGNSLFRANDGIGAEAGFHYPTGVATDGTNLYVTDRLNCTIRKIVIATGEVTTLAGKAGVAGSADGTGSAARFDNPTGIAVVGDDLYVAERSNCTIRKIVIATGEVTTFAGSAVEEGSADGTGTEARFYVPDAMTTDGTSLYVIDEYNSTVRKIVIATAEVTTLAGSAGEGGTVDGTGAAARFSSPIGIATDGTNLYVGSSGCLIRKIVIATGEVTTFAGSTYGSTDGSLADARFLYPRPLAMRGTDLFVADGAGTIRRIDLAGGTVTTLAGTPATGYSEVSVDGTGAAARFCAPQGIATDGENLFVADTANATIRKVVIDTGVVTTLAGTPGSKGYVDGTGTGALFNWPRGITTDGRSLYLTDSGQIRRIDIASRVVTTLAGAYFVAGSTDGFGADARFNYAEGITTDGTNLYVADQGNSTIRKIVIATGEVTTLAGKAGESGHADGIGEEARFYWPTAITTDGTNLYVGDSPWTIRKIVIATREVTTIAGLWRAPGSADGPGADARFSGPRALVTDGNSLYVMDGIYTIRKIVLATGMVSTLAGSPYNPGLADGTGAAARFDLADGITTDGTYLYVSDTANNAIRKVVIATGEVTTLAGPGVWRDGTGPEAGFSNPCGITTDGHRLFVAEYSSLTIRAIR